MTVIASPSRRQILAAGAGGALSLACAPAALAQSEGLDEASAALNALLAGPDVTPLHRQRVSEIRQGFVDAGQLMSVGAPSVGSVEDTTTPSIEDPVGVRIYRPEVMSGAPPPFIVYCHGGSFIAGSAATHDHVARRLCASAQAIVISVDYRLAPEHPFPAALNDCTDVLRWVSDRGAALGGDPARIGLVGDDAGGALAAGVAIRTRLTGVRGLGFLGLIAPLVLLDRSIPFDSRERFGNGGYRPSLADLDWIREKYLGDSPAPGEPSPLKAPALAGMPPTLVISAGFDAFRDDAGFFVRRLREEGVPANERLFASTIHDFAFYPQIVPAARSAFDVVAAQFRAAVGG